MSDRELKEQGWKVYYKNPRWGTGWGMISSGPTTEFEDENLSLFGNNTGQKSLRDFSSKNVNIQNRSPQQSSKPISHQLGLRLNHSFPRSGRYYWAGGKLWAVPKWCEKMPSLRESKLILVQAFQNERGRDEQTQGCENVSVDSSSRAV